MNECTTCLHYRVFQGPRCTRELTLRTGAVIIQTSSGRDVDGERNDKLPMWNKGPLDRATGDVCGKAGRHWRAK